MPPHAPATSVEPPSASSQGRREQSEGSPGRGGPPLPTGRCAARRRGRLAEAEPVRLCLQGWGTSGSCCTSCDANSQSALIIGSASQGENDVPAKSLKGRKACQQFLVDPLQRCR